MALIYLDVDIADSWSLLKHASWDRAHWIGIDSYELQININSVRNRAHWIGIDRFRGCVPVDIADSWSLLKHTSLDCAYIDLELISYELPIDIDCLRDRAYWFGIDRLWAYKLYPFDIDSWACVRVDIDSRASVRVDIDSWRVWDPLMK